MNYKLIFSEIALNEIEKHKKSGNKAILKKIKLLLDELIKHPNSGSGKPEARKHELTGLHSRRIDKKHRLVYKIINSKSEVHILSLYSHYGI